MTFNIIDVLLVVVVLLSALHGWRRGFICGSFDLLRWIVMRVLAEGYEAYWWDEVLRQSS
ncbi:MAG TPA: hypothetical protein VN956_05090 [Pyrinomonadaceae bacterium]|nr:hypothetical protein [Pyrinomonadaceae bacterium]